MSTNSHEDRWLLPRRQTEFPARDLLPEVVLHGRREVTFLGLAALFLVAISAFLVLGTSRLIDVSEVVARLAPALDAPDALVVPLGVAPFAVSFLASALVCDLFGRRRASALVWVGHVAALALVGLLRVADLIDGGQAFGMALAFAACCVIGHASNVIVFDRLRRRGRMLRMVLASTVALALGWAAFAIVLDAASGILIDPLARDAILALAITSAASALGIVLVLAVPAALVMRGLSLALRVGRDLFGEDALLDDDDEAPASPAASARPAFAEGSVARKLPPAVIVDDDETPGRPATPQPFSSAEMRFFSEGDMATE